MPSETTPYAITVNLTGIFQTLYWAGVVVLVFQGIFLLTSLLGNNRSIRKVLRPPSGAGRHRLPPQLHDPHVPPGAGGPGRGAGEDQRQASGQPHRSARHPKELRSLAQSINAMLERINRAYSAQARFVSDASHELRTPIAVIQGYAALLDRWGKDDPEARQEAIDAIRSESDAMERLVEQLLFLARGDNDTQPIRPQLMDLTAVAETVLREEQMIHPERAFLARWQGPVVVRADPGLVKQVMRILMDNSVKYSGPEGRVYLRVSAQEGLCQGHGPGRGDGHRAPGHPSYL